MDDKFISIAIKNLQDVLSRRGISPEALFTKYDYDNNEVLDYDEFSNALESVTGQKAPAAILNAIFASIDRDGDGTLDLNEILSVFSSSYVEESVEDSVVESLILAGHIDELYDGEYFKQKTLINEKPWFKKNKPKNKTKILYFYNSNAGGSPSWSLDDREQDGSQDLYRGGWTRATADGKLPLGTRRWVGIGKLTLSVSYDISEKESKQAVEYLEEGISNNEEEIRIESENKLKIEMEETIFNSKTGKEQLQIIMEESSRPTDLAGLMSELNNVRDSVTKGVNDGSLSIQEGRSMADSIFEDKSSNLPSSLKPLAKKSWDAQADAAEAKLLASAAVAAVGISAAGITANKISQNKQKEKEMPNSSESENNKIPVIGASLISNQVDENFTTSSRFTPADKDQSSKLQNQSEPIQTEVNPNLDLKKVYDEFINVKFSSEITNVEKKYENKDLNLRLKVLEIQRTFGLGLEEKYRGGSTFIGEIQSDESTEIIEIKIPKDDQLENSKINDVIEITAIICGWNKIRRRLMLKF